jgi:type IX secretion system PorP/SprF family membrane protein
LFVIAKKIKYLVFLAIYVGKITGQDLHFSQFDGSLLNLSPAFTGFFNGDYRVGAIYRSQWQIVPVPYSTFSMAGEARLKPKNFVKDMVGVGITFNSDRAGDLRYGTSQLYASGNYIFLGTPDSSLLISAGMNIGWCQVGFDYDQATFDNQFDGLKYNKSTASNEKFDWTKYNYADVNFGFGAQYILNQKHKFNYGLGLHHITNPVITYQGNTLSRLDFKLVNYLGYTKPINENTDIIAQALISKQGKYYEFIPHASLKYYLNKDLNQAILGGLCLRTRDAIIFRMGYHYKTMQSGIAYDITTSKFTAATNRRGAFEIFINYIFKNKPGYISKKRSCPVFM